MNITIKRPVDGSQVTSSANNSGIVASQNSSSGSNSNSKLWERNKMLASLLAKQPTQPATIPTIPASVISATPQDKLPRVLERNKSQQLQQQQPWTGMHSVSNTNTTASARTPMQNQSRQLPRQATNIYLNQMVI